MSTGHTPCLHLLLQTFRYTLVDAGDYSMNKWQAASDELCHLMESHKQLLAVCKNIASAAPGGDDPEQPDGGQCKGDLVTITLTEKVLQDLHKTIADAEQNTPHSTQVENRRVDEEET